MSMQFRILLLLFFTTFTSFGQTSLYVDSSQTTSGSGTSWATAYKTLGEALNVVNASSVGTIITVYVAKGTYYPTGVQNSTDRDSSFVMMHGGLRVLGGYPTGGGTRNIAANPTLLSGAIGSVTDSTDNSYHVIIAAGIYQNQLIDSLVLDGLTVTYGAATGTGTKTYNGFMLARSIGGGMLATSVSKITMRKCRFVHNYTSYQGGGINIGSNTNFKADSIEFINNSSNTSGGALFSSGAIQITGSSFTGNIAGNGGAICHANVVYVLSLKSTVFTGNKALSSGGAIDVPGYGTFLSAWLFDSLTFTGNTADAGGAFSTGGQWTVNTPNIRFRASTFTNNTSASGGGALRLIGAMNLTLDTCSFTANKTGTGNGGAVHIATGNSTLNRVTFMADTASTSGGGALYSGGWLAANFCTFSNNYSLNEGGAFRGSQYATANLLDCIFDSNVAVNGGGGLYMGTGNVKRCSIRGNWCTGSNGGGILQVGFSLSIDNTLFSGNRAFFGGGALAAANWISTTLTNCTMAGDSANAGQAIFCNAGATATLKNCIIWEGSTNNFYAFSSSGAAITATYSTVQSGYAGVGNISSNPLFVLPLASSAAPTTSGNYALTACSPAINAGQNTGSYAGVTDITGHPRLDGLIVDQGAYEFQQAVVAGTITGGQTVCTGNTLQLSSTVSGGTWSNPGPALITVSSTGFVTAGTTPGTDTIIYTLSSGGCLLQATKIISVVAPPAIAAISGASSVCVNSTTLLSCTTTGGVWSSSNPALATVSPTGLVSGVAPGNVTIYYKVTNISGCSDSVSTSLSVEALPVVTGITSTGTGVCAADTLQLSNATAGGTWSSTCTNGAISISASGQVTGINPGSCTVLYTITNSNGCMASVSYPITVYPQPSNPIITGPLGVCTGTPVNYTANPAGGTWSTNNPTIGTITAGSGLLSGLSSGSVTITYSYTGTGGCIATSSKLVDVNVPVSHSVTANLCNSGSGYVFGSQILTTPGTYTYTFATTNGCDSVVTLSLTGSLPPDTTVIATGNGLMAVDTPASYQWVRCETNGSKTPLTGKTNRTFIAPASGSYALVISKNGCTATSGCHTITLPANGVENISIANYSVYPNPTTGILTVHTGTTTERYIILNDITGKQLMSVKPSSAETVLNLNDWAPGIYFITIRHASGNSSTIRISLVHMH